MSTSELESFYQFLGQHITSRSTEISPEHLLSLWREQQDSVAAIQQGLEDVANGQVAPLAEFDASFRAKHNIQDAE